MQPELSQVIFSSVLAGILASLACGLGVFPLLIKGFKVKRHPGIGYALAGGLMFSASVYNLILPSIRMTGDLTTVGALDLLPVIIGILLGAAFLSLANKSLSSRLTGETSFKGWGGRGGLLIIIVMIVGIRRYEK